MSDIIYPARKHGRRADDPKGLLCRRFVRKLLVILGATGGLAWFSGPFFVWWLSTQYDEKTKALSDVEDLKKEVVAVKTEITGLKAFDQLSNANLMRIEDKVDTILLNVEGIGKRLGSRRVRNVASLIPPNIDNILFCRDGVWDIWVPSGKIDEFKRQNPNARMGACPLKE